VAEENAPKHRPRIRKSAPTVRERAAIAQAKAEKPPKPKRVRRLAVTAVKPLRKLSPKDRVHLPNNGFGRALAKVGRFLRRILGWLVPRYFINSWREVRLVTWPGRKETWRLTLAVFIFATVFGAVVYGVDRGLDEIFKKFVLKG
jgi:preprotein translocase SecE subunit